MGLTYNNKNIKGFAISLIFLGIVQMIIGLSIDSTEQMLISAIIVSGAMGVLAGRGLLAVAKFEARFKETLFEKESV